MDPVTNRRGIQLAAGEKSDLVTNRRRIQLARGERMDPVTNRRGIQKKIIQVREGEKK
jgi:hypothetical protein